MKIGVMGTGAVGGYFGGLLARAGMDIHFVARGKHYRAILEDGLRVISDYESQRALIHVTPEPDEIGPVDLLLFSVKSFDTVDAARMIEPMVTEETVILSLQNGIDNFDKLNQFYSKDRLMGGTAFIEASIASPGMILHTGKPGRIVFGEISGGISQRGQEILALFQRGGIDAELSDDVKGVMWSKFVFICGVHGVCTLCRSPLGLVLTLPETREFLLGVMGEVEELARRHDVDLPANVLKDAVALAESYHRNFVPSMLRDLEWRRPMEIEALNGMVAKLGEETGLQTPLNQVIYACLKLENQKILNPFWVDHQGNFS